MSSTNSNTSDKDENNKENHIKRVEINSAPINCRTVTSDIQLTINNCIKKSNSYVENGNKYKGVISSERASYIKKTVESAIAAGKIFTIRGTWSVIREELKNRQWIEKQLDTADKDKFNKIRLLSSTTSEDLIANLPTKQDWESPNAYIEKCEKMIRSRLLQRAEANFYWSLKRDGLDTKQRLNPNRLINRFSRSLFASKEGLALLLQNYHWYIEPDVAQVNFPRCFVLGFPEHFQHFTDNFRLTACISLLKHFTKIYDSDKFEYKLDMTNGKVPISCLNFAVDRVLEYVASQKHLDIDRDFIRISKEDWNNFLDHFYSIVHNGEKFKILPDDQIKLLIGQAKMILNDVSKYWSEFDTDGIKNIWILKPGNKCRGRGIILVKYMKEVEKIMALKLKYVVQKYIEKPLIVYNTKFDIRQWFVLTCAQPLTIWMYKECYLRFSSQNYSLDNFHESLHLTNYAVQCKYTNAEQRNNALPTDNMWDSATFKNYLKKLGKGDKWDDVIYPGMKESIICAMLASQDTMDRRQNTFEMYGADFVLGEDCRPWLLEINCSPDMSYSTSITRKMCPKFMADIIKVVIDRRKDIQADVGNFELAYKQILPRAPPYLGTNLSIRGHKLFKSRTKIKQKTKIDKENNLFLKKQSLVRAELLRKTTMLQKLPKIVQQDVYEGPVIEDLIEELQKCCHTLNDDKFDMVDNNNIKQNKNLKNTNKKRKIDKQDY